MMRNKNILKLFLVILFVAAGTYIYWLLYRKPMFGIDDANIFFIYMRNLVEGYGFVYNPGGERVEGFTSLLWTLIGSIFFLFTSHPEILIMALSILIVSFTLWQIIVFADKLFEDNRLLSPFALFILGAVVVLPGYFDWTILSLMETGAWSFILVFAVVTLCRFELEDENRKRNNYFLSALLIILVMCRPESYLWGIAFLTIRYFQLRRIKRQGASSLSPINILMPFACFIATAAAITLWRLSYFGYPFPNTYYAKVSSNHVANLLDGIRYDYYFFRNNYFLLLVFVLAAIYVIDSVRKTGSDKLTYCIRIIFVSILVALAVPVYTGGDHFGQVRFMQPVAPLFYLAFLVMVMNFLNSHKIKIKMYSAVTVSWLVLFFSPAYNLVDYTLRSGVINIEFVIANQGRAIGNEMSVFFSGLDSLPSVGLMTAGARAYAYSGPSIDLLGLNNVAIAHASREKGGFKNHASFDKKIFYKLAPDIFIPMGFVTDTSRNVVTEFMPDKHHPWYISVYKKIFDDEEFQKKYSLVFISKKNQNNYFLTYANNNFLSRLDTSHFSCKIAND